MAESMSGEIEGVELDEKALAVEGMDEDTILFHVWALLADRKPTKAAEIAKQDYGIDIKMNTLYYKSKRQKWDERASKLMQEQAPNLFERTAAALLSAGPGASSYLNDVAHGRVQADRNRIVACVAVLDRVGFLPHTRRDAQETAPQRLGQGHDLDSWEQMDDEQLRRIAAGRANPSTGV